MKIRGNTIGTPLKPEKNLVKATNLSADEQALARKNIGAVSEEDVVEQVGKSKPYIGANGNWWIGETDTNVSAQGEPGLVEVFIAEYGVTTYEELYEAYNAGKALFCHKGIYTMPLYSVVDTGSFSFCVITTTQRLTYYITAKDKRWAGVDANLCGPKLTELENSIGDIDAALDELHTYAQALIGGEA